MRGIICFFFSVKVGGKNEYSLLSDFCVKVEIMNSHQELWDILIQIRKACLRMRMLCGFFYCVRLQWKEMDFYKPCDDFPDKVMPRAVCQKNLGFLCLISSIIRILDNTQQMHSRNLSCNVSYSSCENVKDPSEGNPKYLIDKLLVTYFF